MRRIVSEGVFFLLVVIAGATVAWFFGVTRPFLLASTLRAASCSAAAWWDSSDQPSMSHRSVRTR